MNEESNKPMAQGAMTTVISMIDAAVSQAPPSLDADNSHLCKQFNDEHNGDASLLLGHDQQQHQQSQPCQPASSLLNSHSTSGGCMIAYNPMCRICHCEEISEELLISPCYCAGSLKYVHQRCLQQWLKSNGMKNCELCKFEFQMQTRVRSFRHWEKLDMDHIERRKLIFSVLIHLIAILCVMWSLYVLIQKTADEIQASGRLEWSFWTKTVVVAIGLAGGVIFMYIQCKMYFKLFLRWRHYNRVILIQSISDETLKNGKAAMRRLVSGSPANSPGAGEPDLKFK